ncbi:Sensor histidine kinase [Petrocella atlantisensis]|uniref:histidine kinase n=1 Tax=Petrocella atlantisensis TaxID=2173034 RepID=A0A3P7PZ95_9FIRM|nr:sensor histidine kinase [Petrocella atlantisensis]MCF8018631.1 sensor histidine kinase [Vallitaleaceae bacterium]VDN48887.1 Sensor histidine kinase [Petrocella atlantisensis]
MLETTPISIIRKLNYLVNVVVILFFSFIISSTTTKIFDGFLAREFLERVQYLPIIPQNIAVLAMVYMLALGASNILKSYLLKRKFFGVRLLLLVDFWLCFMIVYYMNFSYRGIFLLLMMNIITYAKEPHSRVWMLIFALVSFILLDYDIWSNRLAMLSLTEYVDYNPEEVKIFMLVGKNLLTSINEIGFIGFLYLLLQNKINENAAISSLNTKLRETASELKMANMQLEVFAQTMEENAKMKERNRLAREIHDILGHSLTSITTGLEACVSIIGFEPEVAKTQLGKILELSRKGLDEVRRSVRELKVDTISKSELIPAITIMVNDINECTPVKIDMEISGQVLKLKEDEEQTVYRIIQESITNAIRHGKASHIDLHIDFYQHVVKVMVADNGKGSVNVEEGFGLTHIRERIAMLNGTMMYETNPGEGFTINVGIPIRWGSAYD